MYKYIRQAVPKVDLVEKVTGKAKYGGDLKFHGMLYAKTIYSQHPHARIISIDTSEAEKIPGVVAVLTAKDIPGLNTLFGGFHVFTNDKVRYIGDGVALVVAEDLRTAEKAQKAVTVEYEVLPPILTIDDAMAEGALAIHDYAPDNVVANSLHCLVKGDVETGFNEADKIYERTYETQFIEHAYIEPEAMVAVPNSFERYITIYGSIQNPFNVRGGIADALGMNLAQVRVVQNTIGGTFGGKDENLAFIGARAAIAAQITGRPVKIVLTREESILESPKRHPYRLNYKVGVKKDGTITAMEIVGIGQGGGYNKHSQFCNWRGAIHATGCYRVPNINTEIFSVYTNTIYGGAMRGYSSPQTIFGQESLMDEIAEDLGFDPVEFRMKNVFSPGDINQSGQLLGPDTMPAPLPDMIPMVIEKSEYYKKKKEYTNQNENSPIKRGIGLAVAMRGAGLGGEALDATGAMVTIQDDGSVVMHSGLTENGQGLKTVHSQIVAEILGVNLERIIYPNADTTVVPDGKPTVASRGTMIGGLAFQIAAGKVKEKLINVAQEMINCSCEELVIENEKIYSKKNPEVSVSYIDAVKKAYGIGVMLASLDWYSPGVVPLDHHTNQGEPFPTYAWGAVVAEVEVDTETGKVEVLRVIDAHDVGTAVNPDTVKGQIYGGIVMGQGMAVLEEVEIEEGFVKSKNLDEFLIPTSMDMPEMEVVIVETDDKFGPFGAKSVGEPATEIPAAAIVNAIYHATGKRIRNLPCNLERVLLGHKLTRKGAVK
ncbi:MAG: xanthine dehydrogenase family protein molybdopterin-binding subunit [Halanaerobiales bacterium]|nr:xanthine dehydrogenase family protein molybdopterin-binding subunit [Halanaerobiales bacterium]